MELHWLQGVGLLVYAEESKSQELIIIMHNIIIQFLFYIDHNLNSLWCWIRIIVSNCLIMVYQIGYQSCTNKELRAKKICLLKSGLILW